MKKLSMAFLIALITNFGQAQSVPQGMNYQAVARNLSGEVLANQAVTLKIELTTSAQDTPKVFYSETHAVRTNQLGLFTLIIGSGSAESGTFANVPWSTEEVWVSISIKDNSQSKFSLISSSKLLAVPYAFHAGTANQVVSKSGEAANTGQSASDSSETKITGGDNIQVSGKGTAVSPYIVKAEIDSLPAATLDKVIASGNVTDKHIVFNNDENFIETRPANYDVSQKRGAFSMAVKEFPGVNGAGRRSNVVGSFWGYNTNPGGGQAIPGEASYRFAGETFFDLGGGQNVMEFHLPEMHTNSGFGLRPFSMYINRETGIGSANFQMHQFNFKKVNNPDIDWMRMYNDAGDIRVQLQPEEGGTSYFEMNGHGTDHVGGYLHNRAYLLNNGNGLSFISGNGAFSFNQGMDIRGNVAVKGIYAINDDKNPNNTAHSFQGSSKNSRLFVIGDDAYSEKFYITPTTVISSLSFLSAGDFSIGKSIYPMGTNDLNMRFNIAGNNAKLNFISDAGNILAGQVSKDGIYAKSIQTEKPAAAQNAGVLKIGSVVTATIKDVTSKYLQIEIDGISYKIPLID